LSDFAGEQCVSLSINCDIALGVLDLASDAEKLGAPLSPAMEELISTVIVKKALRVSVSPRL